MKASELIILLEKFKEKTGDVEVLIGHDYSDASPIFCVDFEEGDLYILD